MLTIKLSIATCSPEINLISAEKKKPSELEQKKKFLFKIISYNQAWRTGFTLAGVSSKENFLLFTEMTCL